MPVEITFNDSHGIIWRRTRDGKAIELGEPNPPTPVNE
jgi:hypothetical protein